MMMFGMQWMLAAKIGASFFKLPEAPKKEVTDASSSKAQVDAETKDCLPSGASIEG